MSCIPQKWLIRPICVFMVMNFGWFTAVGESHMIGNILGGTSWEKNGVLDVLNTFFQIQYRYPNDPWLPILWNINIHAMYWRVNP